MRALGELREAARRPGAHRAVEVTTARARARGRRSTRLARIAHPSSVPVFKARLADQDPFLRRAAAEGLGRAGDTSAMRGARDRRRQRLVRDGARAMAFALQKLGRNYIPRLVEFARLRARSRRRCRTTCIELGPPVEHELLPHLQDPDASIRGSVAEVLGAIGGDAIARPRCRPLRRTATSDVAARRAPARARRAASRCAARSDPAARRSTRGRRSTSRAI